MDFTSTDLPIENEYPKLVRDNIPQIIEQKTGKQPPMRILTDDNEFKEFLLRKVVEEAIELQHSAEHGNLEEELADVMELVESILALKGISKENLAAIQKEKRQKNGGFGKRILMLSKKLD